MKYHHKLGDDYVNEGKERKLNKYLVIYTWFQESIKEIKE